MKYRSVKNKILLFGCRLLKLRYKSTIDGRLNRNILNSGSLSISDRNKDLERKQCYAAFIQKLEHNIGRLLDLFRVLKMLALKYYSGNSELFKDDVTAAAAPTIVAWGDLYCFLSYLQYCRFYKL
jgi:hypothetical protein